MIWPITFNLVQMFGVSTFFYTYIDQDWIKQTVKTCMLLQNVFISN